MIIEDIVKYTHKIKKINITNLNTDSIYKSIILKINLDSLYNETVRFSTKEKSGFLTHQQKDNDFFIRIPNNLYNITTIYAHFFPKDLYEYSETQQVFSEYDLSQLFKDGITNKKYYKETLDDNNKPCIQSLFKNNKTKDGNYKNFYQTNIKSEISDMTEQGRFPLSSHYRSKYQYLTPPSKENGYNWIGEEGDYPYWEKNLPREILSPLISDGVENTTEDTPLNVYINYEYLPSSTEYHQHFYGFKGKNSNEYFEILEGEKLNEVNEEFGNKNNYRIIQNNYITDISSSFFIDKTQSFEVSFDNIFLKDEDIFEKNKCRNYYKYKQGKTNNVVQNNLSLNEEGTYILKYFIYIPGVLQNKNGCYLSINGKSINDNFKQIDNDLRNQWIYHEVPFTVNNESVSKKQILKIHGPNIINDYNTFFLTNIFIEKTKEYSPMIKYNQKGVFLQEQNNSTKKIYKDITPKELKYSTKDYISKNNLENPFGDIEIISDFNNKVIYNENSTDFYYIHNENFIIIYDDDTNFYFINKNDYELDFEYTKNCNLYFYYQNLFIFTQNSNNNIEVQIQDNYNNIINEGSLSIVFLNPETEEELLHQFGPVEINKDGIAKITNINLKNLSISDDIGYSEYIIKFIYKNNCLDKDVILYKNAKVLKTVLNYRYTVNYLENVESYHIYNETQLPLKVNLYLTDQLGYNIDTGFCELSIDDKITQSTIVENGLSDFYLDLNDLKVGEQIIKIQYYNKFNQPELLITFKVLLEEIDIKPTVPIRILTYGNLINDENIITVKEDNILLFDIETDNEKGYNFQISKDNELLINENIFESNKHFTYFEEIPKNKKGKYIYDFSIQENEYYRANKVSIIIEVI